MIVSILHTFRLFKSVYYTRFEHSTNQLLYEASQPFPYQQRSSSREHIQTTNHQPQNDISTTTTRYPLTRSSKSNFVSFLLHLQSYSHLLMRVCVWECVVRDVVVVDVWTNLNYTFFFVIIFNLPLLHKYYFTPNDRNKNKKSNKIKKLTPTFICGRTIGGATTVETTELVKWSNRATNSFTSNLVSQSHNSLNIIIIIICILGPF